MREFRIRLGRGWKFGIEYRGRFTIRAKRATKISENRRVVPKLRFRGADLRGTFKKQPPFFSKVSYCFSYTALGSVRPGSQKNGRPTET